MKNSKASATDAGAKERSEVLALAITGALDILGPDMKKLLLHHLEEKHGIKIRKDVQPISLEKLQSAFVKILGFEGAKILMEQIYLELDDLSDDSNE